MSVRASNAITCFTPEYHGLTARFMVAMRDSITRPGNGLQLYNAVAKYVNGPLHLSAGYERQDGATRYHLICHTERDSALNLNVALYAASASYRFTPASEVVAMYGFLHDRSGQGNDAQQVGLAYLSFLSKRATLYALAGLVDNRNQAAHGLQDTEYSGLTVTPGATAKGVLARDHGLGLLDRGMDAAGIHGRIVAGLLEFDELPAHFGARDRRVIGVARDRSGGLREGQRGRGHQSGQRREFDCQFHHVPRHAREMRRGGNAV